MNFPNSVIQLEDIGKMSLSERNKKYFLNRKPYAELHKLLLSFGGREVVFFQELHSGELKRLMAGQRWPAKKAKRAPGEAGRCHDNCCMLWAEQIHNGNPNISIISGWALSSDGLWRLHSFCWDKKKKILLETTPDKRTDYFGYELSTVQALAFSMAQVGHDPWFIRAAKKIGSLI